MSEEITLKPCPFCGCEAAVETTAIEFYAYCTECEARGPEQPDEECAAAAWNMRAK